MMTNDEYAAKILGHRCPFCKMLTVQITGKIEHGDIELWQPCECTNCGKKWIDHYKLVGFKKLEPIKFVICDASRSKIFTDLEAKLVRGGKYEP